MTLFITICALLAVAAVALLVWPLLRQPLLADEATSPRATIPAILLAALLPLAAFAAYFWTSNWSWDPANQSAQAPSLRQMVAQLQARLARQPDDLEGWKLLGRSATVLGDYPTALEAFSEAFTRSKGQDADAVVGYAESMVLIDELEIDGHSAELFERALELEPDNARALWYGGIVAYRRGDLPLAEQRWVELQNHELPPDLRQIVAERLAEIGRTTGAPAPDPTMSGPVFSAGAVQLSIGLSPAIASQAPRDGTLFIIARRAATGPPLAVVRRPVGLWPVSVTVTDADAMLPGTTLAGGGPLSIIARISRSGQPIAASGDLYGEVGYDFASASPVSVTIDRIVP